MLKKTLISQILFILILMTIPKIAFSNKILNRIGEKVSEESEYITFIDKKKDIPITIVNFSNEEINNANARRVLYLKDLIEKLKNIKNISAMNFKILLDGTVSASVTSNTFTYQGKEYIGNMINGFSFVLENNEIDFFSQIITSDNSVVNNNGYFTSNVQVITVKGKYRNEEEFIFSLVSAIENPSSIVKENNLETMTENILDLENEIDTLKRMVILVNDTDIGQANIDEYSQYINNIIVIKSKNQNYTVEEVANELRKGKLPVKSKIIYTVFRVYFGEYPVNNLKKAP